MRDSSATNLFGVTPRPPGTAGQRVNLRTNMFSIRYPPGSKWHHYDVVIEEGGQALDLAPPRNRELIDELQVTEAAIFSPRGVYDGRKNLFSIKPYSFHPAKDFEVGPPKRRKIVKIKFAGLIDMNSLGPLMGGRVGIDQAEETQIAVTALNCVIRMAPVTNSNYPLKGSSFFMDIPGVSKDLAKGLKLYRGFFQSVRPAMGRMLINIDVATGVAFQPIPVFDFAMKHFNFRDARQMGELGESQLISLTRVLKGIKVFSMVEKPKPGRPERPKSIKSVSSTGPANYMFEKDGAQVSVMQHMKEVYNASVQYPRAPCVIVNRDAAYPMEFLKIAPHQLLKRPVPPELAPDVLNFSTQRPDDRIEQITRGFQQLQYGQSDYLRGANVEIDNQPLRVDARVVPAPMIEFGDKQTLRVKDGTWNMLRKKMYVPRKLGPWGIVIFDQRFRMDVAQKLATRLGSVMEERGIELLDHEPPIELAGNADIASVLNSVSNKALERIWAGVGSSKLGGKNPKDLFKAPQLIVCVLPFPATEIRTAIKRWGDCDTGVPTQCVVGRKYADQAQKGRDDQYLNNLVLKVHAKLGGTNFIPQNAFGWPCPTMVMGGDVSHPPPGSRGHPSISAVVGSMDRYSCQYAAETHVQASREERIVNLQEITMNLVKSFVSANKTPPLHILFFRDGLSEGQFGTFGRQEIKEMKDAFASLPQPYNPKLTFVCVGKGHHVRFFGDRQFQDRSGNCQPGTVIDTGITHPAIWDFYLQSHPGLKGTSSPSHYTVLHDEMGYGSDKLQGVAHGLCHIYARSTRSVSIPAPVYYADIISARGRFHFSPEVHLSEDGDADYTDQHYRQAWRPLHMNQRQRMYYM